MTVAGKGRVLDLLPEFFADTFVLFRSGQPAGAVASGTLQPILDHFYDLLVFVQSNSHFAHLLFFILVQSIRTSIQP